MEKNNKSRWVLIAVIAAIVAAITTIVVFILRARAKRKAWCEQEAFDYDMDDYNSFDLDDDEIIDAAYIHSRIARMSVRGKDRIGMNAPETENHAYSTSETSSIEVRPKALNPRRSRFHLRHASGI